MSHRSDQTSEKGVDAGSRVAFRCFVWNSKTVRHDGYTCTIVRWIRGHPLEYTSRGSGEMECRSERKLGRYEIKRDKRSLYSRSPRARFTAPSVRIIVAIITPSPPPTTSWRTVRQTGLCLFVRFRPFLSFSKLERSLFLVTRRWKLRLRSRDILRLLICRWLSALTRWLMIRLGRGDVRVSTSVLLFVRWV